MKWTSYQLYLLTFLILSLLDRLVGGAKPGNYTT